MNDLIKFDEILFYNTENFFKKLKYIVMLKLWFSVFLLWKIYNFQVAQLDHRSNCFFSRFTTKEAGSDKFSSTYLPPFWGHMTYFELVYIYLSYIRYVSTWGIYASGARVERALVFLCTFLSFQASSQTRYPNVSFLNIFID